MDGGTGKLYNDKKTEDFTSHNFTWIYSFFKHSIHTGPLNPGHLIYTTCQAIRDGRKHCLTESKEPSWD